MKKNKTTLSIGIPAHNESENILNLLLSIFSQNQTTFSLEKIVVVCDGCTDSTAEIVREFARTHSEVILINDGRRKGKAARLNEIYDTVQSELLFTLDADILLEQIVLIDKLVSVMSQNEDLLLVGPRYVPATTNTLMGKFAEYSYKSFEEAIFQFHDGLNMYALMGCASLIRKKLYKSFRYPKGTISDQNQLFVRAVQMNRKSFRLVKNAYVYFAPVSTFHDWRVLSSRSVVGDKKDVVDRLGNDILEMYTMPLGIYSRSLWKWMRINPLYTTGALLMNILIRVFPYKRLDPKNGQWEIAVSSKREIRL